MYVERDLAPALTRAATQFPAVTLTGPRQSGKSTLCRIAFPNHPHVNLESPDVRLFAREDPRGFLRQYPDGAVLDEVQRAPELLSYLQGLIDADPEPRRWILTGSQNFALRASINQSLAGRTAVKYLLPLSRAEVLRFPRPPETLEDTLLTGGYPRILDQGFNPSEWLGAYVATYVERDVRAVKRVGDLTTFQRFLELCAGRSAQLLNLSSLATDCGVSQPTAKAWLSVLETGFSSPCARSMPTRASDSSKCPSCTFSIRASYAGCWAYGSLNSCAPTRCEARSSRPGSFRKSPSVASMAMRRTGFRFIETATGPKST